MALAVPSVPLLRTAMRQLKEHYFKKPACDPLNTIVVVADAASAWNDIQSRNL